MKLTDGAVLSLEEVTRMTRRDFCRTATVGVVAILLPSACGSGSPRPFPSAGDGGDDGGTAPDMSLGPDMAHPACPPGAFDTGKPPSAFAINTGTYFKEAMTFVCRDAGGLYALTSVCPHERCEVTFKSTNKNFFCPCHGSIFDYNGEVTRGPAVVALDHYAACLTDAGNVAFDGNTTADPADRLAA